MPTRLLENGFTFTYPDWPAAASDSSSSPVRRPLPTAGRMTENDFPALREGASEAEWARSTTESVCRPSTMINDNYNV